MLAWLANCGRARHGLLFLKYMFLNGYLNRNVRQSNRRERTARAQGIVAVLGLFCGMPQFVHAHKWKVGDVVMWDNCSLQHNAVQDYKLPQRRLMHSSRSSPIQSGKQ